jgi:hypothetical protein
MKNIKKLLIYPLAFVVFFGLTANTCLDSLEENLTVDVSMDFVNTFTLQLEEGVFRDTTDFDVNSPEFQEYKDRIENFSADSLQFKVTDNLSGGSANVNDNNMKFLFSNRNIDFPFANGNLKTRLEPVKLRHIEGFAEVFESFVINDAANNDPTIQMIVSGDAQGPVDYTIELTMWGVVKAKATN